MPGKTVITTPDEPELNRDLIAPGRHLLYQNQTVKFVKVDHPAEGRLEAVLDTGEGIVRVPYAVFMAELSAAKPALPSPTAAPPSPLLDSLPPEERARIEQRFADLQQIKTGSRRGDPDGDRAAGQLSPTYNPLTTTQTQRYVAMSRELKSRGIPASSRAALYRQMKDVEQGGIEGLVHGNRKTRLERFAGVSDEALSGVLTEELIKAHVPDAVLAAKARAALNSADVADQISRHELTKLIGELSRGKRMHLEAKARERVTSKTGSVYNRRQVSRPAEMVQVDATTTNIHVWEPHLGWIRAMILTAIDVFTRCILALRVCCGSPTSRDVANLVGDITRPYVTRSGWPYELQHHHGTPKLIRISKDVDSRDLAPELQAGLEAADLIGVKPAVWPSTIVMDHGREFDSNHLMSVCARMGIDVVFCPPRAAHAKGVVESVHNMLRDGQALFAAFKGADVSNHPRGVEELASLSMHDLRDALWEYVITVYHWAPHRGLTDLHDSQVPLCPAGVFEAYVAAGGGIEVLRDPFEAIRCMSSTTCLVQAYGINVDKRVYNSAALQSLIPLMGRGVGVPPRPLTVYWDRWDVSRVYTRHLETGEWLCIPRAGETITTHMPISELFDTARNKQLLLNEGRPLTQDELANHRAEFVGKYSQQTFRDRNLARVAAIEAGRAHDYAHDLADAEPEFQRLAFGNHDVITGELVQRSADSDEILDADLVEDSDDEIDFDAIDFDTRDGESFYCQYTDDPAPDGAPQPEAGS